MLLFCVITICLIYLSNKVFYHQSENCKSGDRASVCKYCPISLLCIASKVLERIIYDKVYPVIQSYISLRQFGFYKIILLCIIFWSSLVRYFMSCTLQTDVIYTDIRKAFDTVPHSLLLLKLRSFGIQGNLLMLVIKISLCMYQW